MQLKLELKRGSVHNGTDLRSFNDYFNTGVVTQTEASGIHALADNKIVDFVQ